MTTLNSNDVTFALESRRALTVIVSALSELALKSMDQAELALKVRHGLIMFAAAVRKRYRSEFLYVLLTGKNDSAG